MFMILYDMEGRFGNLIRDAASHGKRNTQPARVNQIAGKLELRKMGCSFHAAHYLGTHWPTDRGRAAGPSHWPPTPFNGVLVGLGCSFQPAHDL
jgi:hypothetical protein